MTTSTLLMQGQALALSNTMRMPLVLILSKRRMRFLLGHSRIPLRHLHILVTEHLADGLHRHTCLQRNEAGERVPSRMVGIGKSVLYSTSTSKAFWMESNNCSMSLLVSTASLLLPSNRLARGFQSDGVQDNLQENCAIVLFTVMRPMMGAFPFLSIPLFFR